jgi:acetylglutamate kinase
MNPSSQTTVIKLGGALLADADALSAVLGGVRTLAEAGPVVLVHGGGPQAIHLTQAEYRLHAQKAILEWVWGLESPVEGL